MDNGSQNTLTIERLAHGGFVITRWGGGSMPTESLCATTTIDEALRFIREKMQRITLEGLGGQPADGKVQVRTASVTYPKHYDSQGYCDNPGRGY